MKKKAIIISLTCIGLISITAINGGWLDKLKGAVKKGKEVTEKVAKGTTNIINAVNKIPPIALELKNITEEAKNIFSEIQAIQKKGNIEKKQAQDLLKRVADVGDKIEKNLENLLTVFQQLAQAAGPEATKLRQMSQHITTAKQNIEKLKTIDNFLKNQIVPLLDEIPMDPIPLKRIPTPTRGGTVVPAA